MKRMIALSITIGLLVFTLSSCMTLFLPEPSLLSPANQSTISGTSVQLEWVKAEGAVYDLWMWTTENRMRIIAQDLTKNRFTYYGIKPGMTHHWRVVTRKGLAITVSSVYQFDVTGYQYYGVVYGASDYSGSGWSNLPLTANDANDLDFALKQLKPAYMIQQKRTGQVTSTQIFSDLDQAASQTPSGSVFLFFYAGHGGRTGNESYLATTDGQRVTVSQLRERLDQIQGPKIVIIDACNSGSFTNLIPGLSEHERRTIAERELQAFNAGVIEAFASPIGSQTERSSPYPYYVLTAASIHQSSWESSILQNGVFSFFLLDGIGDVGIDNPTGPFNYTYDADANGDGIITLKEGFEYVAPRARQFIMDQGRPPQDAQVSPSSSHFPVAHY